MLRTGLIGQKVGMTSEFTEDGSRVPVTVISVAGCQVTGVRTQEKDGYTAVQLGYGARKAKNVNKAQRETFAKAKVEPKAKVVEFRVDANGLVEVGAELSASHFQVGQKVDVTGITIGRGFAGAMKRHNFGGLRATHGVSVSHRSHGSTGGRQDPGRVFKNKKMAGHMGAVRVTTQNLTVIGVDAERGLITIKGSVPGFEDSYLLVRDAVKSVQSQDLPFPAAIKSAAQAPAAQEPVATEAPAEAVETPQDGE